jgi:hypothetical protein
MPCTADILSETVFCPLISDDCQATEIIVTPKIFVTLSK